MEVRVLQHIMASPFSEKKPANFSVPDGRLAGTARYEYASSPTVAAALVDHDQVFRY
jgi:hypothetical protein